ncbi:uncharacterized protein [Physcomitrium patens]|uniref:uncharacterized protein isoform X3 n=1 Tax=Physcomitrium patens TaxID=3218 RepID=UPI003CCDA5A7
MLIILPTCSSTLPPPGDCIALHCPLSLSLSLSHHPHSSKITYLLTKLNHSLSKQNRNYLGHGLLLLWWFCWWWWYLVKLKDEVDPAKVDEICSKAETNNTAYPGYCTNKYKLHWIGMLIVIRGDSLYRLLDEEIDNVEHVEVEGVVRVSGFDITITKKNVTQIDPTNWGLDRIDHQANQPLLNKLYTVTSGGSGVHIYVVDTGIRCTHVDFGYLDGRLDSNKIPISRCLDGFDAVKDGYGTKDCNGHGTHCAGIAAGLQSGVAKSAFVHPVRALTCEGNGGYGMIMASLDWINLNAIMPAIISMSLGAMASISIDQAITNLMNTKGIFVVVAGGNFHEDACRYSPARVLSTLAVGSSTNKNVLSWFSNYGPCISIIAPGELITSAWNTSDTGYNTLSGTSMACPHVAGAAALYLGQYTDARSKDVRQALLDACEPNAVSGVQPSTTTKLLNVVNLMQPSFVISPRAFYNATEGSTQGSTVSLRVKPKSIVILTPTLVDASIGYFQPPRLCFPNDASWSMAQTIKLCLNNRTADYLDRGSVIRWAFSSLDATYNICPEGYIMSLDTAICKWSVDNPCGQTLDNPKIIPKLPFTYYESSFKYKNVYNSSIDFCHNIGPDVVFQYTAISNMSVMVSLNGSNTDFDTLLSAYERTTLKGVSKYSLIGCNDDAWTDISILVPLPLKAGSTYIFIVDGWNDLGGNFDFIMQDVRSVVVPYERTALPLASTTTRISSVESDQQSFATWSLRKHVTNQSLPRPSPPQTSFFWSAVTWGPCSRPCGGGSQEAVHKCYSGNYVEADRSKCVGLPLPRQSQVCNFVECRHYNQYTGPWSECDEMCGQGKQTRQVMCMDNLGNVAHLSHCGLEMEDVEKSRPCHMGQCNATYWDAMDWEFCNVPCGGGKSFREIICRSQFQIAKDSDCSQLPPPMMEKVCNTHPCQTYTWSMGPWSDCEGVCNANQTRQVQCVDELGNESPLQLCATNIKPISSTPCSHTNVECNNSLTTYCSKYGRLQGGNCLCEEGWEGPRCEILKKCLGRPLGFHEGKLECCPYSTVDVNHKCCATPSAAITSDGLCCEEGILDACGQCNGLAKFVDSQHKCCNTIRDEKGICCQSGVLDECHICDGDGITCATNVTMSLSFDSNLTISNQSHEKWKPLIFSFVSKVATQLGLADDAIILSSIDLSSHYEGDCTNTEDLAQACLNNGTYKTYGTVEVALLPKPNDRLTRMVTKENEIHKVLHNYKFSTETCVNDSQVMNSLHITNVPNIKKTGICGNGECEKGERCDMNYESAIHHGSNTCCFQDCPYVSFACPIPPHGPHNNNPSQACSRRGICLDASGQCKCFLGYAGLACEQCMVGWARVKNGSICVKDLPQTLLLLDTTKNPVNDTNATTSHSESHALIIIIAIAFVGALAYFAFHWWEKNNQRFGHVRLNHEI